MNLTELIQRLNALEYAGHGDLRVIDQDGNDVDDAEGPVTGDARDEGDLNAVMLIRSDE